LGLNTKSDTCLWGGSAIRNYLTVNEAPASRIFIQQDWRKDGFEMSSSSFRSGKGDSQPPEPSASAQDPPDTKLNKLKTNVKLLLKRIKDVAKEQREAHNMKVYGTKGRWLKDA